MKDSCAHEGKCAILYGRTDVNCDIIKTVNTLKGVYDMRRADRKVTDINEIVEIIKKCQVCRLAFQNGEYPYIIPLNFGMTYENGVIKLFFHSALEGEKVNIMQREKRATFEMDCEQTLHYDEERGYCTMSYESVIGRGEIEILSDEEKIYGLRKLMKQYHGEEKYFNENAVPRTLVYALTVNEITAKKKV